MGFASVAWMSFVLLNELGSRSQDFEEVIFRSALECVWRGEGKEKQMVFETGTKNQPLV